MRSAGATAVAAALCLVLGCGDGRGAAVLVTAVPPQHTNPLTRDGATESLWVQDVRAAKTAADSEELVDNLVAQVEERWGGVAAFNVVRYGTSTWTAPWWVVRHDVRFDDCQGRGDVPEGLYDGMAHFADVPIPSDAVPSPGRDNQLTVYAPSTDQLWELWRARRDAEGWSACWGGRIDDVSTSLGAFDGAAGASASGLAVSGGALTLEEASTGEVGHALSLAVPDVAAPPRLSWPAQRSDGTDTSGDAIPMGQRFRLPVDVDVDALGLHPVAEAVARAAQTYGVVVTDTSGAVSVSADLGEETVVGPGAPDPWREVLDGTPAYAVLEGFPWDQLEALPQDWGEPAG
ncbi:hypothetical protein [Pseudokineococcus sp. 1T1Z-3]|uniref:hypothetical protein n=1 Tax=Pseudokineococcus sp. 1T1Z-3 TaxID=3132745 RepID=UPI0030AC38D0